MKNPKHPGSVLYDAIIGIGLEPSEFETLAGLERNVIRDICWERASITPELANQISEHISIAPEYWTNLQNTWDTYYATQVPIPVCATPRLLTYNNDFADTFRRNRYMRKLTESGYLNVSLLLPIKLSDGLYIAKPDGPVYQLQPSGYVYKTQWICKELGSGLKILDTQKRQYCINPKVTEWGKSVRLVGSNTEMLQWVAINNA